MTAHRTTTTCRWVALCWLLALFVGSRRALPAQTVDAPLSLMDGRIVPPVLRRYVPPALKGLDYNERSRTGVVAIIDTAGHVATVTITHTSGDSALDAAASQAVYQFELSPATLSGKASP